MRNLTMRKIMAMLAAAVGGVVVLGATMAGSTASAGDQVTSAEIRDGAVRSPDLKDGGVHAPDLADRLKNRIDVGRMTRLEADGPYPGATDLGDLPGQGDNSDERVLADGEVHTVWVQCAPGKTALGGGFTLAADAGTAAAESTQVVASYPAFAENGALGDGTISGDDAMSIRPNAWAVDAINSGSAAVVVRPWVVCAKVTTR